MAGGRGAMDSTRPLARPAAHGSTGAPDGSMVTLAALSASAVAWAAGAQAAAWFIVAASSVPAALSCTMWLLAEAAHKRVADLIIDGDEDVMLVAVQRERRRLLDARRRDSLAHRLEDVSKTGVHPLRDALRPIVRVSVTARAVGPELTMIAALVRAETAGVRGIAMTERVLCDRTLPLYGREVEPLREELDRIRALLVG